MGKYFGTDGIRGVYGETLTDEIAYNIGNILASLKKNAKIVIGRDTRLSGDALANAIARGIIDGGGEVLDAHIIPTPTIAYATIDYKADYGVVVSASHNPPEYNGIKVFDSNGRKLPEEDKAAIEEGLTNNIITKSKTKGKIKDGSRYASKYINKIVEIINTSFAGHTVVLDCADGAASTIAAEVFMRLGAKVTAFNNCGDGSRINCNKGALFPKVNAKNVTSIGGDIGFAFDGDADRLVACDKKGRIIDGDLIIYAIANYLKDKGMLTGNTVVGTLHTNLAVEQALKTKGIELIRTNIGDQYVAKEMIDNNYVIGGEQSGHIIIREFLDTGDGVFAAAYLMKVIVESNKPIEKLVKVKRTPQINRGIIIENHNEVAQRQDFVKAVEEAVMEMGDEGRILVRPSGTEPKIRIMVEHHDRAYAESIADRLEKIIGDNK